MEDAERDRRNFEKTDIEHSMYVFKDGVPYLEITEGDFTKVKYRKNDKQLEVEAGTKIYHLDKTGTAMLWLIPATGMDIYRRRLFRRNGKNSGMDQLM